MDCGEVGIIAELLRGQHHNLVVMTRDVYSIVGRAAIEDVRDGFPLSVVVKQTERLMLGWESCCYVGFDR